MKIKKKVITKIASLCIASFIVLNSITVNATVGIPIAVPDAETDENSSDTDGIVEDVGNIPSYETNDIPQENDSSSQLNNENVALCESLQDSWDENPNGSRYTEDYAYYKVGGLTEQPDINAPSAILMDAATGFVLYSKNATKSDDKKYYPASMTKVMTALVAIENGNLDDMITFSENAVNNIPSDATKAGFSVGDTATLKEVLYGLFMASGADSAMAIAEHYGGSVDEFVKLMNTKAQQLGCLDTNFVNPHGLHDANHYTTAYDMALIMQEAIRFDDFRDVLGTKSYTVTSNGTTEVAKEVKLQNRSALLSESNENYYEFAKGSKTGHTNAAKYTLVSYSTKNNETLICVVLEEDNFDNSYSDHKRLYEWGYKKTQVLTPLPDQNSIKSLIRDSVSEEKYKMVEQYLTPKYLSNYGILTNTAIKKDEIRTFFVYDEDMYDGILGYMNISYYNKVLIGRTPILYETQGDNYNNYLNYYNTSKPPIVIGADEPQDVPIGIQSENVSDISEIVNIEDVGDGIENIDPFVDTSSLDKPVSSQMFIYLMIYGMILTVISMIVYIIILCCRRKSGMTASA